MLRDTAFAHRDFTFYWLVRVVGRLGIEILIAGVSWHAYQLTGRALDLGLIGLAQFAPFLLLFLAAGAVADRFQRARILGVCAVIQTFSAIALFWFTTRGVISFPQMFGALVLLGTARAFQQPALQAIMPLLVPKARYANAVAWSSAGTQMSRIGGPAIAGGLLLAGQGVLYGVAVACLALSAVFSFLIGTNTQQVSTQRLSWGNLLGGFSFIRSREVILGAILLDLFAVLLGGATALLPIYAVDILQVGEVGFGSLRVALVVGTLAGSLYLTQRPFTRHAGWSLLGSVIVFGASIVVFGVSTHFWLSIAALFTMGAADAISIYVRMHLVQIVTPDEMLGRVSAVNAVFVGASNELGEFESGVTAAWWGVVPAVVVGGVATIGVAVICAWLLPQLRRVDSLDHDELVSKYR